MASLESSFKRTCAPRILRQLRQARAQLRLLDQHKAEYALVCLKHKYYSEGNKVSKMLAYKLRVKTKSESISTLLSSDGRMLQSNDEILEEFRHFYKALYDAQPIWPRCPPLRITSGGPSPFSLFS